MLANYEEIPNDSNYDIACSKMIDIGSFRSDKTMVFIRQFSLLDVEDGVVNRERPYLKVNICEVERFVPDDVYQIFREQLEDIRFEQVLLADWKHVNELYNQDWNQLLQEAKAKTLPIIVDSIQRAEGLDLDEATRKANIIYNNIDDGLLNNIAVAAHNQRIMNELTPEEQQSAAMMLDERLPSFSRLPGQIVFDDEAVSSMAMCVGLMEDRWDTQVVQNAKAIDESLLKKLLEKFPEKVWKKFAVHMDFASRAYYNFVKLEEIKSQGDDEHMCDNMERRLDAMGPVGRLPFRDFDCLENNNMLHYMNQVASNFLRNPERAVPVMYRDARCWYANQMDNGSE